MWWSTCLVKVPPTHHTPTNAGSVLRLRCFLSATLLIHVSCRLSDFISLAFGLRPKPDRVNCWRNWRLPVSSLGSAALFVLLRANGADTRHGPSCQLKLNVNNLGGKAKRVQNASESQHYGLWQRRWSIRAISATKTAKIVSSENSAQKPTRANSLKTPMRAGVCASLCN